MPKLPGIDFEGNVPGPTGIGLPNEVHPESPVGQGLQRFGAAVSAMGNDMADVYQKSQASNLLADKQKHLQDFTLDLKYGAVNPETGQREAPADPTTHAQLYQQEVDRILEGAGSELSGSAVRYFDSEFRPYATRAGVQVQVDAIDQMHSRTKVALEDSLAKGANNFVDAPELVKPQLQAKAERDIQGALQSGAISPEQAQSLLNKFNDDTSAGSIMKMVKVGKDPVTGRYGADDAVIAIDAGEFSNVNAEKLQRLRSMALEEGDRQRRRAIADADHAEAVRTRNTAKLEKETAKEGISLAANHGLTQKWVDENRDKMSVEYFNTFNKMVKGGGSVDFPNLREQTKILIAASTGQELVEGKPILDATLDLVGRGEADGAFLKEIVGKVTQEGASMAVRNWRKRGSQELAEALKPKKDDDPAAAVRYGDAMREWDSWAAENPGASPAEASAQIDEIRKAYSFTNWKSMTIGKPIPSAKYLPGGRTSLPFDQPDLTRSNLVKASKAVEADLAAKKISEAEAAREARRITELLKSLPAAKKKEEGTK